MPISGQLTEQALDFALRKVPSADAALRAELLDAYWRLDCYPEVPAVLKALKASGAKLAILSNGSPEMLQAAVKSAALDQVLDDVFSVDTVRRFKTDPVGLRHGQHRMASLSRLRCRSSPPTDGTSPAPPNSASARCGSTAPTSPTNTGTFRRR